ncbi:hypothetical protein BJ912DRAFT_1043786 [Pholiota molesta]|nr:hypothetical protein BJ912DRAFT_1043786 [Pholiota molesta]
MEGDHVNSRSTCSPSEDGDKCRSIDIAESKPHPDLWFDDGLLVIQASSVRYRVHRTILCKHSSIFRDMVAMPQPGGPSDDENTFEGCPLVRLPDSPDDLSALLEAIYGYPDFFRELQDELEDSFEKFVKPLSGILRLSIKYEFQAMRKEAIQVLENLSPIELDEFKNRCTPLDVEWGEDYYVIEEKERLFSIIELAKSCGLMQFLPSALYRLSCLLAPDGSQDHLFIESSKIDERLKSWCLSGRTRLSTQIAFMNDKVSPSCMKEHKKEMSQFASAKPKTASTLFNKIEWPTTQSRCHKCILQAEKEYYKRQQHAWDLLPDYFGFPEKTWDELEQSDTEMDS